MVERQSRWRHALLRGLQVLGRRRARILAYHSVSDCRTDRWSIGPQHFEQHLRFLSASDVTVVSLEELVCRMERGLSVEKRIAITFDDGYRDFIEYALPILRDYQFPATVFVPIAALGQVSAWSRFAPHAPIMTVQQVECVGHEGVAIGSHSLTHRRLTTLSDAAMLEEIDGSQRWLHENLGVEAMAFAYPFGDFGSRERVAVQRAGYRCAAGFGGLWGNDRDTDRFALNRDPILHDCDGHSFQSILTGRHDWVMAIRSMVRLRRQNPLRRLVR